MPTFFMFLSNLTRWNVELIDWGDSLLFTIYSLLLRQQTGCGMQKTMTCSEDEGGQTED